MTRFKTMAVLAVGMTFWLACGDAARTLLPPDAGAQGPDGGGDGGAERPAPKVIEIPCEQDEDVPLEAILSTDELMIARVWVCGTMPSDGEATPDYVCDDQSLTGITNGTATAVCYGRRLRGPGSIPGPPFDGTAELIRILIP